MSYTLIDSGSLEKLEQIGPYRVVRPSPAAIWRPRLPASEWDEADAHYHRSSTGGGRWVVKKGKTLPANWTAEVGGLTFRIKPTDFGHVGLFAEQQPNWDWITETCTRLAKTRGEAPKVLNLFAHTGGSTLAAAKGGASVTHVDASKGVVTWAHENADLSGLGAAQIRWIVDDVTKFCEREQKRGARYDGIILDPPSFGRGSKGELWKIDEALPNLLAVLKGLLSERPGFVLITSHSAGYAAQTFANLLSDLLSGGGGGGFETLELGLTATADHRILPSGNCARWRNA